MLSLFVLFLILVLFVWVTHIGIFFRAVWCASRSYNIRGCTHITAIEKLPEEKMCIFGTPMGDLYFYIILYYIKGYFNIWAKRGDSAASDRQTEHTSVSAARVYPIKGYFSYIGDCL
jgi:hypothetical protein